VGRNGKIVATKSAQIDFHGHSFQEDLPNDRSLPSSKFNYDLIAPVELIVAGRTVTACLSAGWERRLGRKQFVDRRA
jgi:hypothetical protein